MRLRTAGPDLPLLSADRRELLGGAAAVLAAALVGAMLAANVPVGMAALLGLCFAPLAFIDLRLGLALWFPLVFLEGIPAFNLGGKAGGLLIVAAWLGAAGHYLIGKDAVLRQHGRLVLLLGGFLVWLTVSAFWASDPAKSLADLWHWYAVALLMVIVATVAAERRAARWMVAAFVVGAVLAVGVGIVTGGLTRALTASDAVVAEGRLVGGQGDPNFLAAGIVPGLVLATALLVTSRNPLVKLGLVAAMGVLALGLVASESRGGAIAVIVALVAGFCFFRRRRAYVLGFAMIAVGVAAAWFSISPAAWERVTGFDKGGSGRNELWTVALRMAGDRPVNGVGLNNYKVLSAEYVQEPGMLTRTDLIVDRNQEVHSAYIQMLAEAGGVGLLLLLAIAFASVRSAWLAGRKFERIGDGELETLARGVLVATLGLLAASFFISNGVDKRLWVLFGLGPALLVIANRMDPTMPEEGPRSGRARGRSPARAPAAGRVTP